MRNAVLPRFLRRWPGLAAAAAITAASFAGTPGMLGVPATAAEAHAAFASAAALEARQRTDVLRGYARVSDGDTITIGGATIRIHGIDAPEAGQTCRRGGLAAILSKMPGDVLQHWQCGTAATNALARLVEGKEVACEFRTRDKYKRLVSVCYANGRDVGAEMVRMGMAWAFVKYAQDYAAIESEARAARRGIWQAETETAWDYRAKSWEQATAGAPSGCPIKGNINAKGERIYHTPWSPWYAKVRMEPDKGKRWFCSEDEAQRAGWRPAVTH